MEVIWNSSLLADALKVDVPDDIQAGIVQFNSKDVEEGDIFIALTNGDRDGHIYAADALKRGAAIVILSKNIKNIDYSKCIIVDDTHKALDSLAKYKRAKSNAKFIAITGSVGKTSTKEILATILSDYAKVFFSRKNFNNHLGLAINLASLPDDAKYAVIEVGMNHADEIRPLSKIIKPDIAVITNVYPVHLENFKDMYGIADAKSEIFSGANSSTIAILSRDNEYFDYCVCKASQYGVNNIHSFGSNRGSYCKVISKNIDADATNIHYEINGKKIDVSTNILGEHVVELIAISFAILDILGLALDKAIERVKFLSELPGRGQIVNKVIGDKKYKIIDDSYNASPISMKKALKILSLMKSQRRVAVLADMKELGVQAKQMHIDLEKNIVDAGVTELYTIGPLMGYLSIRMQDQLITKHYNDVDDLIKDIKNLTKSSAVILFKGSFGMNLKKAVDSILKKVK